jgi:hypothetical protein
VVTRDTPNMVMLGYRKEIRLEVNIVKTKHMPMSHHQNAR